MEAQSASNLLLNSIQIHTCISMTVALGCDLINMNKHSRLKQGSLPTQMALVK